jgi:hypothetical protein
VAIQGPPLQPYDPLDRRVASLLAMTIPSKRDVLQGGSTWSTPKLDWGHSSFCFPYFFSPFT